VESWIDSYFEFLTKADTETGQREALALKRENFPKALYRYRSLEHLAYTLEELREGYVFLSEPANFNDPYDSALSISWEQARKQAIEEILPEYGNDPKFVEPLEEKQSEYERQAFESFVGGILSLSYGPSASPDLFSRFRENLVGVSCFATNPNSVVMWSHYANQHTGICIDFSGATMLSSANFLELLHPVRYTENFLDVFRLFWLSSADIYQVRFDVLPILAACHKSKDWDYEGESRPVSLDPDHRKEPEFSLNDCGIKPSQIILGTKIDKADRAAIEETADKISVPVVNARLAEDRFEIKF
jgi:Protein of unknown function (DUF2971)